MQNIETKLAIIRDMQKQCKGLALCGSIGLLVQGIELPRGYESSDLDFIVHPNKKDALEHYLGTTPKVIKGDLSCADDFEITGKVEGIKVEVAVTTVLFFDRFWYNGHSYLVQEQRCILRKKAEYADKGVLKHIDDIRYIKSKYKLTI